ncbi:type IV toxin-antitoxin system AbiEi family antitoxin domain-containing protein [Promicromonospora sp. NPDC057138]|uniref:type IV toxin-antitoxin system AbiEi family antitoxin domain-containing protein n=1 Tax=Promicromonospora sp. NPDC057138 TaxID=3346031 RepID=UPI00363494D9
MPKPFKIPADAKPTLDRQQGLLTNRQCDEFGISRQTRSRLVQQDRWRRPLRGVYDTDPVPLEARVRDDWFTHAERWRTWLALLSHGPETIAVGTGALVLHGVQGLPRDFEPEVAMPDGSWRASRFGTVRQYTSFPTIQIGDRDVARIDHALAQGLPGLPRDNVLAVLDDVARRRAMTPARLAAVHDLLRGRPGAAHVHDLFPLVDKRSESTAESSVRLSFHDNGIPPDDIQVRITMDGTVVARVDFIWRLPDGRWLVVEVDGVGPHSTPQALVRDAPRQNQLLSSGLVIMLRFKPKDNDKPGGIGKQVARVLKKHGWRPGQYPTPGAALTLTPATPPARQPRGEGPP